MFSHQFLKTFNEKVNVNTLWNFIKQKLMKIMDDHVSTKFSSLKNHQPWITTHTKRLLRRKHRLFQKTKGNKSRRLWKQYKSVKKDCQKECSMTHSTYLSIYLYIYIRLTSKSLIQGYDGKPMLTLCCQRISKIKKTMVVY